MEENQNQIEFQENDADKKIASDVMMKSKVLSKEMEHFQALLEEVQNFVNKNSNLKDDIEELAKLFDEEWERKNAMNKEQDDLEQ